MRNEAVDQSIGTRKLSAGILRLSLAAVLFLMAGASVGRTPASVDNTQSNSRLTSDITGSVATHAGERIRVRTELGSINIRTQDSGSSGKVDYRLHLETDGLQKGAQELLKSFTISAHSSAEGVLLKAEGPENHGAGRLWVTLELMIPKNSSLEVSTGGGNIDAGQVNGRVSLFTAGGNITTDNIGGPAHLDTGGGNIVARNIAGELYANSGGGHITIGSVAGNATLRTSGGHIRVASVEGTAHFETGGGNITLEHSGAELTAETGGGEIQVGEAAGLVRARTSGGGIRVVRTFGPTDLETSGGSIYLTQVDSSVRASTTDGGITAWFVTPKKTAGMCQLQSGSGDIVVHLPRELAVTIDAMVERGSDHQVIVDPAFPLKVSYDDSSKGSHIVRAEGELNGGGDLLRLRTIAGNIRFVLSDVNTQLEMSKQQMLQMQQQLEHLQQDRSQRTQQPSQLAGGDSGNSR